MIDILKEMGKVCRNRQMAEEIKAYHRRRFDDLYLCNLEQADAHRRDFLFWCAKINDMNEHIKQLHSKIKLA
jgi:phosphopentomutase